MGLPSIPVKLGQSSSVFLLLSQPPSSLNPQLVSLTIFDQMVFQIQPIIPLFQGHDYDMWSTKMRTLFISEDLWELVDKGYKEDEIPADVIRDVRKSDAKALFFIQQAVTGSTFPLISKATKSKEAWDSLRTKYQKTAAVAQEVDDNVSVMDSSVYKAAATGKIETLREEILKTDPFHPQLSPMGNTILHIASEFGNLKCVDWILSPPYWSLLQCVNLKGETALHLAAREGRFEVVKALINFAKSPPSDAEIRPGADKVMLRMENKEKHTPLHEAVRYASLCCDFDDELDLVKFLIEEDPDFSYGANASGITPLYMAAESGITGLVKLIIDKSTTSPAYGGLMGRTALHAAVICNDEEMTRTILGWKPGLVKEVDEKGWSPLHWAAERGCDEGVVKLLLEKSDEGVVYLKTKDENRRTALHIAAFHRHWKIVKQLLDHCPGCREQIDDNGNNVIHYAFMKKRDRDDSLGCDNSIDWLEMRGLKNEKNSEGNAPIHLLALNQISDLGFVGDWGVDKKAYNNENLTAYNIISRAEDDIAGEKAQVQSDFDFVTDATRLMKAQMQKEDLSGCFLICVCNTLWSEFKEMHTKLSKRRESKEQREKRAAELEKKGETHLIVSALITTVTFAAGFTLPGGYDSEDGRAILAKRAAFTAFVVTDTIAMLASLCAVFLHFFMTMRREKEFLEAHLVWAFILTMVGMGGMTIAFATGLYAVLPHSSVLALVTCILCSCFFLSFILEYCLNWRGTLSGILGPIWELLCCLTVELPCMIWDMVRWCL